MVDDRQQKPGASSGPATAEIPFIYPAHWEADVVLRDGATAHLRPVLPTDKRALETMYAGQSERTIYLRFFAPKPTLSDKELTRFTTVDHLDRVALVIYLGEELIGIGRYDRTHRTTEAEVAFMISDRHQGRGIGSILLEHLAAAAKERGIQRFTAEVLPENRAMLNVFSDTGYEISREFDDGVVTVGFDIDPTDRSRQVMETREHRAESQSIAGLLTPRTVAVIGDKPSWKETGLPVLHSLVSGGFRGVVYGVCPGHEHEQICEGARLVGALDEIPEQVDLALIAVPVEKVSQTVAAAGAAGVRGCLIYTEFGAGDRARQRSLVRLARKHGMRIIGPTSWGILNNDPAVKLDATLTPHVPRPGTLGIFSQSPAIGSVLSHTAVRKNIGVSSLVSAGHRADVSGNDLMQYWEDDPRTAVCALYLESIGNPRKFSRIARRLSRTKPLIVSKNTFTGLHLPPGHAGRTSIAPTGALDSMFHQSGVISAESSEQVLDIAQLVVSMPLPAGRRLAVVSNAVSLGQMVADRAAGCGIEVRLSETVTIGSEADYEAFAEVFTAALDSSDIDVLVGIFLTEGVCDPHRVSSLLLGAARATGKLAVGVFPGIVDRAQVMRGIFIPAGESGDGPENPDQHISGLPCYTSPAPAIESLASVMNYTEWRSREKGVFSAPSGVKPKDTADFIGTLMPRVQGETLHSLNQGEISHILSLYGIHLLPFTLVSDTDEALAAVDRAGGYPVVLKSTDEFLARRIDLGGIRLNIANDTQLAHELVALKDTVARYGGGSATEIALQKQVPAGQAAVLEAIEDPLLGPVISFGMSGDPTALLGDWAHRIPPLTAHDVHQLIREPKAAARLFGENELPAVRVDLLEDLTTRIALLKDNHPEIGYLQLAPIIVTGQDLTVAMARMKLGNPQQRTDSARRTMNMN